MNDTLNGMRVKPSVSIKSVAIPAEHGGWGFLIEPLLLGLLIAPSLAGVGIGIAATAVFLLHQPVKIVVKDRRKGRLYERTRLAQRFLVLYSGIAAAALAVSLISASDAVWLIPLLMALPFAGVQLLFEFRSEGRSLISELFGALALAATAPAILLASHDGAIAAAVAWGLMALRTLPAILYVRTRLRLIHGKAANRAVSLMFHVAALVIAIPLWASGMTTPLILLGLTVLLARAIYGLWVSRPVAAKTVGFQEVFFGLFYAIVCALALIPAA
ncbi:MAG: YwiC-like family protein [Anaerolineae bacterium]